jgi:hypothetical protein
MSKAGRKQKRLMVKGPISFESLKRLLDLGYVVVFKG